MKNGLLSNTVWLPSVSDNTMTLAPAARFENFTNRWPAEDPVASVISTPERGTEFSFEEDLTESTKGFQVPVTLTVNDGVRSALVVTSVMVPLIVGRPIYPSQK